MERECTWRRECPEIVRKNQLRAMHSPPLFLLRQSGPAAFIIKDERKKKPIHVLLGEAHSCTCHEFRTQRELCVHLCWVLLRKLTLQSYDPLSFQLGLNSRELYTLLHGKPSPSAPAPTQPKCKSSSAEKDRLSVAQRPITPSTICPICLEEMLAKRMPVMHCRFGCGNPVHIKCMTVVATHQVQQYLRTTKPECLILCCPLCRGDFDTLAGLREHTRNAPSMVLRRRHRRHKELPSLSSTVPAVHLNVMCIGCLLSPVLGNLFRCTQCPLVTLCASCVMQGSTTKLHGGHTMAVKQRPGDHWQQIPNDGRNIMAQFSLPSNYEKRQMSNERSPARSRLEGDFKMSKSVDTLPEELLRELPSCKIREGHRLLARGHQCCLCLQPYKLQQRVRQLLCGHQFHDRCCADWLLNTSATCPIDGTPLTSALLLKALQRQGPGDALAQHKKRRPLSCLRSAPLGLPTPAPAAYLSPPEMSVRRLSLADRRDHERGPGPGSGSATPRYLCRADLPERDGTASASEARLLRHQVFNNRAYSLPARPLPSGWRPHGGPNPSTISLQQRKQTSLDDVKGCPNHGRCVDTAALSVTSLCLPDDVGVSVPEAVDSSLFWGGQSMEGPPSGRTPRLKPLSHSPRRNSRVHQALRTPFHALDDSNLAPALSVTCTRLKLAARSPSAGPSRVWKP